MRTNPGLSTSLHCASTILLHFPSLSHNNQQQQLLTILPALVVGGFSPIGKVDRALTSVVAQESPHQHEYSINQHISFMRDRLTPSNHWRRASLHFEANTPPCTHTHTHKHTHHLQSENVSYKRRLLRHECTLLTRLVLTPICRRLVIT